MNGLMTKKVIAATFKELLKEKTINKITIGDIAERCGINRQTFYYHFQDIIDLVEWICLEDADNALKNKNTYATWQEGFIAIFELIREDKIFINNIYKSVSLETLMNYLYKLVYPIIYDVVDERSKQYVTTEENKKFITNFYEYSFVAVVLDWVKNDMKGDPTAIVTKISFLVDGTIDKAIKNMNNYKQ